MATNKFELSNLLNQMSKLTNYLLKHMLECSNCFSLTGCSAVENHHMCNCDGRRQFLAHLLERYVEMNLDLMMGYNFNLINEVIQIFFLFSLVIFVLIF